MSNLPTIFQFENHAVRSVMLADAPWFVAVDVCGVLDLSNPSVTVQALDDDERAKFKLGRQGEATVINESGLYTLILRSRGATTPGTLPHRFRKWVTAEVLPAIRRTDAYAPQTDRTDLNLRLVAECREIFGIQAARGLWRDVGLPAIRPSVDPEIRIAARRTPVDLTTRVANKINRAGIDGIYRRHLMRFLSDFGRAAHLDVAIADLTRSKLITATVYRRAAGGRPSTLYRWVSHESRPAPVSLHFSH